MAVRSVVHTHHYTGHGGWGFRSCLVEDSGRVYHAVCMLRRLRGFRKKCVCEYVCVCVEARARCLDGAMAHTGVARADERRSARGCVRALGGPPRRCPAGREVTHTNSSSMRFGSPLASGGFESSSRHSTSGAEAQLHRLAQQGVWCGSLVLCVCVGSAATISSVLFRHD